MAPPRRPETLPTSNGRPRWFLARDPVAGWRDGGDALVGGDLHSVLIGVPAFAGVRLLVVLPLLAGCVDAPVEVVGELGLSEPVVLVGGLGEAVGPLENGVSGNVNSMERRFRVHIW